MRALLCIRRYAGAVALWVWFAGMLVLGAGLLSRHQVAFRPPAKDAALAASLDALRSPRSRGQWLAAHVLYAECRCSQRVVDHLLSTERPRGWSEMVLWVGNPAPRPSSNDAFDVRRIGTQDLARYGIEAAPMLIAVDPAGRVRYAGGYTDRKQGPVIDDLRIIGASRDADIVSSLPVFGCAVSDRLKRELLALPVP